jgi:ABC-2 type transport system permease protein
VPLLWVLYRSFYDIFFQTKYADSVGMSESQVLRFSSPWAITLSQSFASEQLVAGDTGIWPTAWYLLFLLVIAVVLFAICLCLYRIRRTEAAGQALAFRKTEGIVKLLLSIPAALLAALIAYELMHSLLWEILFIVIFGSLACIIMEFIYRWDIRQALAHKLHIALTLFAAAAIFLTFRLDLTGFDTYLPAKDEIAAMAARYSFNEHLNLDENGLADANSYGFVSKEQLDQFETEDFEDFYRLAENGVENVKRDTYDGSFDSVAVKYRLKNGKEIYRCYNVESDVFLEVFDSQKEQEEFVETYYPIMTWSDQTIAAMQDVVFYTHLEDEPVQHLLGLNDTAAKSDTVDTEKEQDSDEYYEIYEYEISDEDIERLVEAYREDILECSYEDCWMDGGSYISFRLLSKYSYYVEDSYPVTEAFTNTIAVLRDILKDVEPSVSYG